MPDVTQLQPGDPEAIDEYRLLSRLGVGGQGVVYLATTPSGDRVAIKRLLAAFGDERTRLQFAKEVSAAQRVAPFCTAQVVDVRLDGTVPYVVSEYIDGLSLHEQVRDHGPVTGVALQRLAIGTATALTAIHAAGVVHRDLKPANVMLAPDGPRVIDFGVARDLSLETTVGSRVLGTPVFMAPEQLRGERVGPAADLFAWASVIAYAATGRTLFEAPHVVAVIHRIAEKEPDLTGIPADLLPIVRRCLNKDPEQRPSAQQALVELLGRPGVDAEVSNRPEVLAEAAELVLATRQPWAQRWSERRAERRAEPRHSRWELALTGIQSRMSTWDGRAVMTGAGGRAAILGVALIVVLVLAVWSGALTSSSDQQDRAARTSGSTVDPKLAGPSGAGAATGVVETKKDEKNSIPSKYRGSWIGSYEVAGNDDQGRTVQIDSDDDQGVLVISFTGLGCAARLYYMNSSTRYLNLAAETSSDLTGACGKQASVMLQLTAADELLMTWDDAGPGGSRITAVLRRV